MIKPDLFEKSVLFLFKSDNKKGILNKIIFKLYNKRIGLGPFAGMKYLNRARGSAFIPKILGTYEKELHPFIYEVVDNKYEQIVVIGAAEGYYAVGLAYLYLKRGHHNFRIHAYDINRRAQVALRELSELNNVEEFIEVKALCSHEELNVLGGKNTFVICDIEGGEAQLLDPSKAASLYKMNMLVELHDGKEFHILNILRNRFEMSHSIKVVDFNDRTVGEAPWWLLFRKARLASVSEGRKLGLKWMYLKVK